MFLRLPLVIPLLLLGGLAAASGQQLRRFDIPQQPLSSALIEFSRQSGINVVVEPALVAGKNSRAVRGEMDPEAVLRRLLEGSGLRMQRSSDNTIMVQQVPAQQADAGSLQLTRVAMDGAAGVAGAPRSTGEAEDMIVQQTRIKPVTGANLDLPRTTDDPQPYYIFDAVTIRQSGATNIEDFLKQRLTMNTVALTNGQESGTNTFGNTSSINLRGVGTDKTLVLVNGRRIAGVMRLGTDYQPDLNGIPMNAIERIEVMPSSASGIYGGGAIGGVVNIILRRDYSGGEIQAGYDNPWEGDAARRTVTGSWGMALEGGRTQLSISASWSDSEPLVLQDRRDMFERNIAFIQAHAPDFSGLVTSWQGVVPNIYGSSGRGRANLVLANGTPLNSQITFVPKGTSPDTDALTLAQGLLQNAGNWNYELPPTTQSPTGLLRRFGTSPTTQSVRGSVRRQMLPWLDMYLDASYTGNEANSVYNPVSNITVGANVAGNPFRTSAVVSVPYAAAVPATSDSENRAITLGATARLPGRWTGVFDYTWSENRFNYLNYNTDDAALTAAVNSGAVDPFVDTLLYPLDIGRFLRPTSNDGSTELRYFSVRAYGPLPALPWGQPTLMVGAERRESHRPPSVYDITYSITTNNSVRYNYFAKDNRADALYAEALVPLIKRGWAPLAHALELQLAGRTERFDVGTGSAYMLTYYQRNPVPAPTYGPPTLNGEPVFSRDTYTSRNYTVALKYQPVEEVTLRVSRATAFLPPTPDQLIKNPVPPGNPNTSITDPLTGPPNVLVKVQTGGNPDLTPQNSRSLNAGVIWQPKLDALKGLRLDVEYYRIQQFDAIATLGAQAIVNLESVYPGRVTRDTNGAITLVDNSLVNLYERMTEGFDLSADYQLQTRFGQISLMATQSVIKSLTEQYSLTQPAYEAAGYHPADGGSPRHKSNATLAWQRGGWNAGWTVRYTGAYKVSGAAGSPFALLNPSLAPSGAYLPYITAQDSDTVSSQTYHDLFVSRAFTRPDASSFGAAMLDGVTVQFGVRNVLDKEPPLDVYYRANYFVSPFGDTRLRSYWLNLRKEFGRR